MADLPRPVMKVRKVEKKAEERKAPELSPDLAAAVTAVTAPEPSSTAAPFITAMQKEAVLRAAKRRRRVWLGRAAAVAMVTFVGLHFLVTRLINRVPQAAAALTHAAQLKTDLLPFYSTVRQPLQVDELTISAPEAMGRDRVRYVAQVTLRLRKPLYAPAVTNGTAAYRQLQVSLQAAREQELRYNLFEAKEAPEAPALPLLLQRTHRAGDSIVVKVPFTARRFGWIWKFDEPEVLLRLADRAFEGDSIEFYAGMPHLIFGAPDTLAEVRERTKAARDYVVAVAKQVQRRTGGRALDESLPAVAAAEAVAGDPTIENRPAIDPDAPAIELPSLATTPAQPAVNPAPAERRG